MRQKADPPGENITTVIYAGVKYNCSIPFYEEVPADLANYSWAQVSSFTVKPKDCMVTLTLGSDPILATVRFAGANSINSTVQPTTTVPNGVITTTVTQYQTRTPPWIGELVVLLVILFAISLAILAYKRHRKQRRKAVKKARKVVVRGEGGMVLEDGGAGSAASGGLRCARCNHPVVRVGSSQEVLHGIADEPTLLCLVEGCSCSAPSILKGRFRPPKGRPKKSKDAE